MLFEKGLDGPVEVIDRFLLPPPVAFPLVEVVDVRCSGATEGGDDIVGLLSRDNPGDVSLEDSDRATDFLGMKSW